MTPERWRKIEEIFQAALDCAPAARSSFVAKHCGDDEELYRAIEKLVGEHDTGNPFLESPVWTDSQIFQTTLRNKIGSSLSFENFKNKDDGAVAGETVGSYRLEKEIGRGGMGVVYLAARAEDFRQKVAVKIVKRGMDTDFVVSRFRQERQVLAALNHPFIARLLDGGTTRDGRPFLVMEYVEGVSIDRFCDDNKLTIEARLKLFRSVCRAVAYSHQRLIIHRDIKPSNILVTKDGEPKLLDFGIAKLLDRELASGSLQTTAASARMLTPDYAAPEQFRGETVTTASDVYSLGVVLYLLLTGHLPFNFTANRSNDFALLVSEQSPERPSAVITKSGKTTAKNTDKKTSEPSSNAIADNRRTQPERLRRYLADDLDNIVLKALRKETARRYSSVEQLVEDIERHLAGLPVAARGDDFFYKARKFFKRHLTAVIAASLVLLTLFAGIVATARQARIANRERMRAELESARAKNRFDDARRLTESLMFELHDKIRDLPGATEARELLATRTLEHLDKLVAESSNDASLQSELAIAYINLGNIQGNPYYANLGDTAGALASYRKAERLTENLSTQAPDDFRLRRRFWLTQIRIGDVLMAQGDLETAKRIYENAHSTIVNLAANNPAEESLRADLASSFDRLGNVLMQTKDYGGALEVYSKAQTIFERAQKERPEDDERLRAVAAGYSKIGAAHLKSGAPETALVDFQKALQINESRRERNPSSAVALDDVAGSRREVADAQTALGDYGNALENYGRQLEIYKQLVEADAANVKSNVELAISYERLGNLQIKLKNFKNAVAQHEKALTILRELVAKNAQNTFIINQLPLAYYYLGDAYFRLASSNGENRSCAAARSFFRQSLDAYLKLPAGSVAFLDEIKSRGIMNLRNPESLICLKDTT